jgi:diaminopimelate epimerase
MYGRVVQASHAAHSKQRSAIFVPTMELHFAKWQGTGNDFIMVDDREATFPVHDLDMVRRLCDRHFGIGSDGLVLIQAASGKDLDFHMEFFNPDGSRSFCGNGSRCAFAFWNGLEGSTRSARFSAIDGAHSATWVGEDVAISLPPVDRVHWAVHGTDVDNIHTGSPHELVWVVDVDAVDIRSDGPERRYATRHGAGGSNVNYVQPWKDGLRMRTYERGVEAETLSCGSGVVAAALSALLRGHAVVPVAVGTRGGELRVEARRSGGNGFDDIRLIGPVRKVFHGTIIL